jgi:hypothetical protein
VSKEWRVNAFLKQIKEFGIPEEELFHTKDLTELRNVPRVCRCLATFRKMVKYIFNIDCGNPAWLRTLVTRVILIASRDGFFNPLNSR